MGNLSPTATHSVTPAAGLSSLRARLQSNPQDGEAWLALALLLAETTTGRELRQAISESIRLLPDNCQAWLLAGLELQNRRGTVAALQWLRQAGQQHPQWVAPRLACAQLLGARQDEAASAEFRKVIEEFPQDSRACLLYAEYLQSQRQPGAAGDYLARALELQPGIVENWTALAKIRLAAHRLEESVVAATRALELDPKALEALMTRAEAYRQAAQWPLAKADYQHLLRALPKNPYVLMGLGASQAGERDFAAAMRALAEAVELKPDLVEARLNIALVHACQGESSQAEQQFRQLLASHNLSAPLRESAGICLATLEEHRRLKPCLANAAESNRLDDLQAELLKVPGLMLQTDTRMSARLRELAQACGETRWPQLTGAEQQPDPSVPDSVLGGFIEACLTSRVASEAAGIASLWTASQAGPGSGMRTLPLPLVHAWQAIQDRQARGLALSRGQGEAWLRYWHYRLFQASPADFPGQFKFAPNSIGLHRTVAPQHLVRAVRFALDELGPGIKPALGRACFMLVAIAWIHAFVDGNGRMSRFAFAAELESAGLPAVVLLTQERKALTDCQDQAQYHNNFAAFARFLPVARDSTLALIQAVRRELEAG